MTGPNRPAHRPVVPVLPILTAVTGDWEAPLVGGLEQVRDEVVVVRRCVDLPDLLATAGTGQARAVVVSADLRRLDSAALSLLAATRVAVVGLVDPGDEPAERRLRQLGVNEVLAADATPQEVAESVVRAVTALAPGSDPAADPTAEPTADPTSDAGFDAGSGAGSSPDPALVGLSDPAAALSALPPRGPVARDPAVGGTGRLVAVWGPTGAPGRTTVAVTLAAELAALAGLAAPDGPAGRPSPPTGAVLADADTYGGSIAQLLGLLDEAPGLAAAARAADHGTLDLEQLARAAPVVTPGLRVLTGISRPHRWPELRAAALSRVLALCRVLAPWTVVDCGFSLEQDEEFLFDTAAPRRNGATLVTLTEADVVVAVGSGDPVGLQRLVRGLVDLTELRPDLAPVVVVNRVRGSAVGGNAESRIRDSLARYAGVGDLVVVPDDRPALDAAMLAGRTLSESAPASPARQALAGLARQLAGRAPGARRARRA